MTPTERCVTAVNHTQLADSALLSVKLLKNGTLKVHEKFPHGMCATYADVINAELLAVIQSGGPQAADTDKVGQVSKAVYRHPELAMETHPVMSLDPAPHSIRFTSWPCFERRSS